MGSKWIFILGIILGLIAAALTYIKVGGDDEVVVVSGPEFMRLTSDANLAAGDRLTPDLVTSVSIPLDFEEVRKVAVEYTDEVEFWLINNDVRVSRDVPTGSFILHEHLLDDPEERFANIISKKGRAISLPVSEISSVSYFVEPGSRVDILTTLKFEPAPELNRTATTNFEQPSLDNAGADAPDAGFGVLRERVVTRTILQNVLVLAVGQATTRNAYLNNGRSYGAITLDVTPEEAEILTFLMTESTTKSAFNLVLRNPVNVEQQEIDDVDWKSIAR